MMINSVKSQSCKAAYLTSLAGERKVADENLRANLRAIETWDSNKFCNSDEPKKKPRIYYSIMTYYIKFLPLFSA